MFYNNWGGGATNTNTEEVELPTQMFMDANPAIDADVNNNIKIV